MPKANQKPVDLYSLLHMGAGAVMAAGKVPLWATIGVAVGWEAVEPTLKRRIPKFFPKAEPDSLANSVGDVVMTALGWGLVNLKSQDELTSGLHNRLHNRRA